MTLLNLTAPRSVGTVLVLLVAAMLTACAHTPEESTERLSGFERWRRSRADMFSNDFGELTRYRAANAQLGPPRTAEPRVVFFGDSITDGWDLASYFPGKPYVNRGISGQTTPQMLVRFRQDVIALRPAVVVVLAGTNDIAGNTGPMVLDDIDANYRSMVELAKANGIQVVMSSVLPVHDYTAQAREYFLQRSPAKILELNRRMREHCAHAGCVYLDYFAAMVDTHGALRRDLADDGLHPNESGYKVMVPLAEAAIATALARH